jgi:D-glycero-D-manno-heptose 1,7-bisphosphate phosphatase
VYAGAGSQPGLKHIDTERASRRHMRKDQRSQRAVFVDRDGTLIRDVGHLCRADQLEILPQVPEALRLLKDHGFKVVVITNQSVIARGRLTEGQLADIHRTLLDQLAQLGGAVDGVYYCPHHPTEGLGGYRSRCDCRKPNTGMIRRAAAELGLAVCRSYVVGDQLTDMELAARSGAQGIWIHQGGDARGAAASGVIRVVEDLWEAARWIASRDGPMDTERPGCAGRSPDPTSCGR